MHIFSPYGLYFAPCEISSSSWELTGIQNSIHGESHVILFRFCKKAWSIFFLLRHYWHDIFNSSGCWSILCERITLGVLKFRDHRVIPLNLVIPIDGSWEMIDCPRLWTISNSTKSTIHSRYVTSACRKFVYAIDWYLQKGVFIERIHFHHPI